MRNFLRFLVSLVVLSTFCTSLIQAGIVADGLVANWSFDQATVTGDTVRDLAGNYDATMKDNPKIVPGVYGEAIEFNGTDSYLELTTMDGFGPQLNTFSLEFWLKTPSTPDWTTFFKILNDGCTTALGIDLNRTAVGGWAYSEGNTHFYVRDETCNALAPEIQTPIYDDKWHHIAWVVEDAANNATVVYVDGEPQDMVMAFAANPQGFVDFMHPVYLGAANNRGNIERFCPTLVDEFRFYTKALNEDEINQNMGSGAAVDSHGKLSVTWGELRAGTGN
jgi:hypothetical protein